VYDEVLRAELTPALHRRGVTQEVELAYNHNHPTPLRLTGAMYMTRSRLGLADSLELAEATFEAHSRPSVPFGMPPCGRASFTKVAICCRTEACWLTVP
jgi:hypothetical protein